MGSSSSKIIYPAEVIDNQDPMNLGRIRAYPLDRNVRATLEGFAYQPKDAWTDKDPFVVLPLLPQFLSQVPEIKERVNLFYQNHEYPYQDVYYVQGSFPSPMSLPYSNIQESNKFTSLGDRVEGLLRLKNNDGSFKNSKSFGIFPQPGDNALLGRGFADVVVKRDTVLLRAAKTNDLNIKRFPIPNDRRSFIQISGFNTKITEGPKKLTVQTESVNVPTKKLIEWDVQNLENTQDAFTGQIRLYGLKPLNSTFTDSIQYDSDLGNALNLVYYEDFFGLTFEKTLEKINNFIKGVNSGKITNGPQISDQFPFAYRPTASVRAILESGGNNANTTSTILATQYSNGLKFTNGITLNAGLGPLSYKFGLVRTKDQIGKPIKINLQEITTKEVTEEISTPVLLGGTEIFLLSHKSNKQTDLSNSIYGFTQQQIQENILPFTSSAVRGEELLDLLNLIVRFLITHVHPVPGAAPVPVGLDGIRSEQILFEIRNAANKILNTNIRLN